MTLQSVQVRCPFCNGAHASKTSGQYTCDYCLQPFTTVDAQREESRLLSQVQGWLEQKLGSIAAAGGGAAVDASSRAYIFQQKVYPELRRDIDRALEPFVGATHSPLVLPPVPFVVKGQSGPYALLRASDSLGALKELRVRAGSDAVGAFAVSDADRAAIAELDLRVNELMDLVHVAKGGHARSATGYAAARRTLELMAASTGKALAAQSGSNEARREFMALQQARFESLCELCRAFEEAVGLTGAGGAPIAARLDDCIARLEETARGLEACAWNPGETMPLMVSVKVEAEAGRTLQRWLSAHEIYAAGGLVGFLEFVEQVEQQFGTVSGDVVDALGSWCEAIQAIRGQVAVHANLDFSWGAQWAESQRARKTLGLFGNAESLQSLEGVLVPFWLGEVSHSVARGAVFKSGGAARSWALVNATAPKSAEVLVVGDEDPLVMGLLQVRRGTANLLLSPPRSSAAVGQAAMTAAVRARAELLNASVRVSQLVYLPAVFANFSSKAGDRTVATCLAGRVGIDEGVRAQAHAARTLVFGRVS
jgi:hypothetical protein